MKSYEEILMNLKNNDLSNRPNRSPVVKYLCGNDIGTLSMLHWKIINHVLWISHHCFVAYHGISLGLKNSPVKRTRMLEEYAPAYLTLICFSLQTGYLALALACDAAQWKGSVDAVLFGKLKYWRDVIFNGLIVPNSMFVSTMFWCLYWIDRELVFPAVCDADVPAWMVHCTHTNILFVVASEALLQSRSGPLDGKLETKMNACCAVLYAAMYYTIFLTTGDWLYPVFGIFTWWQICMFQGLVWLSIDLFYRLQFPVYRLIHGSVNNKEKVANGLQKTLFNIKDAINSEPKNKTCDIINAEDRSR